MNIDKTSADIAVAYLYPEISEICYALKSGEMSDDDAIVNFRYAMALCDVLSELNAERGKEIEELIYSAMEEYDGEFLSEIQLPSWP